MDVVKGEIVQIKEVLKKNPRGINVIDIAKQVNMNRQTVTKYLEMLIVSGNVDVKTFGPSKVYYLTQRLPVSSMISLSSDFIILLDKNQNVVNVNDSFLEFTKTKKDDILGKGIDSIPFPMEFDPPISPNIADALDGKESRIDAYYKKRGKEHFYGIKFIPIAFDDGQPGATIMLEDITERKRAEEALRESEARHKVAEAVEVERKRLFDVLETLPAMICLLTADHRIAFANRSFTERFGESIGRPCYESCFGSPGPCEFCESYEVFKTGQPHHWELNTPDGSVIEAHDYPFTDVDGTPLILEMDVDITERKRIEKELKKANRAYKVLAKCKEAMIHAEDEKALIEKICQIIVDVGGYPLAWIGYVEEDEAGTVRPVAWAGVNNGYVENLRIALNDPVRGAGPTAQCMKTGRPLTVGDVRSDPRMAPWREDALARGFLATLNIPVVYEKHVIGNIAAYAGEANAFNENELELMFELAGNLAYGITALRDRAKRFAAEEELRRSRDELDLRVKERTKDLREKQEKLEAQAEELEAQAEELRLNNEELENEVIERKRAEEELRNAKDRLEAVVQERTAELQQANRMLRDEIAERVDAEKTVSAERRRLNDVLETLPAYLILLTPDHHVAFANRFFRERFGESHGRRCFEYLFGRGEPCENCETYKVMKTGMPHRWEWTGPDGHNYDIHDFPFKDADGSPLIMEMGIDITERKRAELELDNQRKHQEGLVQERTRQLKESNEQLAAILEVTESAMSTLDIEELLKTLLYKIIKVMKADASVILLKEGDGIKVRSSTGIREENLPLFSVPLGQGFAGTIAQSGEPGFIEDAMVDPRIIYPPFRNVGLRSMLGVPIRVRGEVIGVVHVDWKDTHPYNRQEQDFLQIIADRCGMAIVNAELYERSRLQNKDA